MQARRFQLTNWRIKSLSVVGHRTRKANFALFLPAGSADHASSKTRKASAGCLSRNVARRGLRRRRILRGFLPLGYEWTAQMNISEGALAEVTEGMALVTRAETHLNHLEARLKHCRVHVDDSSFRHIRFYLDQLHAQLAPIPLQVAEAKAAKQ
jgi:hypothetical protein